MKTLSHDIKDVEPIIIKINHLIKGHNVNIYVDKGYVMNGLEKRRIKKIIM
jgi:hypothetical protein